MYDICMQCFQGFPRLKFSQTEREQTLIALRSFNGHNDASWAYKGSNKAKVNSQSKEKLKLPTGASSLVKCNHLCSSLCEVTW